ncbi:MULTISPECIES: glycan biosynthesis hexose transferase WsfD [unclassified Paenibacillus]|uniref:glycan biosynthesis hexose transferase WsfD n=1 Tax=unclassified Paenibacillus TaxID=185978 RepID=UPI0030FC8097
MIDNLELTSTRPGITLAGFRITPAFAAAFCVLLVTAISLFTSPYIGMADNGDFYRIIYSNGLYFNAPDYDSQYFGYFVKQFGIFQYFNENSTMVVSSQSLFIKLAIFVNKLFFSREVFDIRFQAAIYTVLYVAAVYLLVEAITVKMSPKRGMAVAALAVFIFGDTGYTNYFSSFFGESLVMVTMILVFASWLLLYRKRYNDYAMLAILLISTLILTTSKQQNAPVGMVISLLSIPLVLIRRDKLFRWVTLLSAGLMMFAGIATYLNISKEFVNINQYHAMTRGVLMESKNPEIALDSFGINEQYAILKENTYYDQYGTVDVKSELLDKNFYSRYGFVSILTYYASHPNELGSILDTAAESAYKIKPAAMGNYEQSAGKEFRAQSHFFSLYSTLKEKLAPRPFAFILLWMAVTIGVYMPSFARSVRTRDFRGMQRLLVILATMLVGLSGIVVSIIGAGDADIAKHEFLFTLAFDLIIFQTAASVIGRGISSRRSVPSAPSARPLKEYPALNKGVGM